MCTNSKSREEDERKTESRGIMCIMFLCGSCIFYNNIVHLIFQGIVLNENNDKELSPSEQRALKAEKKAAWRQARLKSLEQVMKYCKEFYIE